METCLLLLDGQVGDQLRPVGELAPGLGQRAGQAERGDDELAELRLQPWENGYAESFNSKVRDELLAVEEFASLLEARVLGRHWKRSYNHERPHSALGYMTPAEFGEVCPRADSAEPPPPRGHTWND